MDLPAGGGDDVIGSPTAALAETPEAADQEGPVTLNQSIGSEIPTIDPQRAGDSLSITSIENLFVQLTNFAPGSDEVIPEAAIDWAVSPDGRRFEFILRKDIPWVRYDDATGLVEQVLDKEGNPRYVTADDFVYGIKRACDPNLASYYSTIIAPVIAGCEKALEPDNLDDDELLARLLQDVGVNAEGPDTLVVELTFPASYFFSMTPMWTLSAAPSWVIEEHGDRWTHPDNIVTNGRFALSDRKQSVRMQLTRNPLIPSDLQGRGNIQVVEVLIVPDPLTAYQLWLANEIDQSSIPGAEMDNHLSQYGDETQNRPSLSTMYIGFRTTKPPVDDVRVRRALSAAIDRDLLVETLLQGLGLPMIHFAPPGIFGAPPLAEVGVGFDPQYAREQLALAGYPDCEGLDRLYFMGFTGQGSLEGLEFYQGQWQEHLGCDPDHFQLEQLPFADMLAAIGVEVPDSDAPHMYTLGWGADFPDEENFVGSVLWCGNDNPMKRACGEVDELIVAARREPDGERRVELYRQIEEAFFGAQGEMPLIPLFAPISAFAEHSWLDSEYQLFGGSAFYNWTIDWPAKQAAQRE